MFHDTTVLLVALLSKYCSSECSSAQGGTIQKKGTGITTHYKTKETKNESSSSD